MHTWNNNKNNFFEIIKLEPINPLLALFEMYLIDVKVTIKYLMINKYEKIRIQY